MTQSAVLTSPAALAVSHRRATAWRILRRDPLGSFALLIVLTLVVLALLIPLLPLQDPAALGARRLASPGAAHLLGTDELGRDVLSRTMWGSRISVFIAVTVSLLSGMLAVGLGIIAGYVGGVPDFFIQRGIDFMMALPWIVVIMAFMLAFGGASLSNVALTLSILYGIRNARIIRAVVQQMRSSMFIEAARAIGVSPFRILWRHVAPNTIGAATVLVSTVWGTAIIAEATLSFLGLGTPPTRPSWGQMVAQSRPWMETQMFYVLGPAVFIGISVWALNLLGDFIRDLADPRLRHEAGNR